MALKIAKAVVGVKEEAVAYTYGIPGAGECWPAFDISISYSGDSFQRTESRQILGKLDDVPGPASVEIGFKTIVVGSGTAGTAPHYNHALRACGMQEADNGTTDVTYYPWSVFDGDTSVTGPPQLNNPFEAASVVVYEDGVSYGAKGCAGNVKFICKSGEPMVMEFLFKGAYVAVADTAIVTPTGVSTETPPTFLSAGLTTIGAASTPFESLEYDLGNDIQPVVDANDSAGVKGYTIVDRRMVGRFDPDMVLVGTDDVFGDWRAGTTGAISTGAIGTAGNRITFTAGRCQYRPPSMADRNGFRTLDQEFAIVTAAGASDGAEFSFMLD